MVAKAEWVAGRMEWEFGVSGCKQMLAIMYGMDK